MSSNTIVDEISGKVNSPITQEEVTCGSQILNLHEVQPSSKGRWELSSKNYRAMPGLYPIKGICEFPVKRKLWSPDLDKITLKAIFDY